MKKFSKLSSVLALGAAVCMGSAIAAEPLTVVSWGGAYSKYQQQAYSDPFTATTVPEIVDGDKRNSKIKTVLYKNSQHYKLSR